MLEQSPAPSAEHHPQSPEVPTSDAATSSQAAAATSGLHLPAELSTELMWQPDDHTVSGAAQASDSPQDEQLESLAESQRRRHHEAGSAYGEESAKELWLPAQSVGSLPVMSQAQLQAVDSQDCPLPEDLLPLHDVPDVGDIPLQGMAPGNLSSSPDYLRPSLEQTCPGPTPGSPLQHTAHGSMSVRAGIDLTADAGHANQGQGSSESQFSVMMHDMPLGAAVHQHTSLSQSQPTESQTRLHTASATEQPVSGRSTLFASSQAPAIQADSAASRPQSASSSERLPGIAADGQHRLLHDNTSVQQQQQQADSHVRSWASQQLGYEDSTGAVAAGARPGAYQSMGQASSFEDRALSHSQHGQTRQEPQQSEANVVRGHLDERGIRTIHSACCVSLALFECQSEYTL